MTASAVLPDDISRDPKSLALYVFLQIYGANDPGARETTARALTSVISTFRTLGGTTACVGFGVNWFAPLPQRPSELLTPPTLPQGNQRIGDVVVYAISLVEEDLADLLISFGHVEGLTVIGVERGFQRASGRELSGFRDGLRNARDQRPDVVFVDRDRQLPSVSKSPSGPDRLGTTRCDSTRSGYRSTPRRWVTSRSACRHGTDGRTLAARDPDIEPRREVWPSWHSRPGQDLPARSALRDVRRRRS